MISSPFYSFDTSHSWFRIEPNIFVRSSFNAQLTCQLAEIVTGHNLRGKDRTRVQAFTDSSDGPSLHFGLQHLRKRQRRPGWLEEPGQYLVIKHGADLYRIVFGNKGDANQRLISSNSLMQPPTQARRKSTLLANPLCSKTDPRITLYDLKYVNSPEPATVGIISDEIGN